MQVQDCGRVVVKSKYNGIHKMNPKGTILLKPSGIYCDG